MNSGYLKRAIELAESSAANGGGPFGALVVKDGAVLAEASNRVAIDNDPTAHAEVVAMREACRALGTFQLAGCEVYSSCEPCPMCLGALYWARPAFIYFAATRNDAAAAGFDDSEIYRQIALGYGERSIATVHVNDPDAARPFQAWKNNPGRVRY
jgi:guanine deaminase